MHQLKTSPHCRNSASKTHPAVRDTMTHPALSRAGLYAITDGPRPDLLDVAEQALSGGTRLLQYRDKTRDAERRLLEAQALASLCRRHAVALIINDDVDLAVASAADGVHLGEDDADPAKARERLGPDAIIGVSCYDNLARARTLTRAGADYLAFGAFHPSPTKPHARKASPDLLRQAATFGLPLVAIGGINADNGRELIHAGADFLAVISAVFDAPDVHRAAHDFQRLFASSTDTP